MRSFVVLVDLCVLAGASCGFLPGFSWVAFYCFTVACMVLKAPLVVGSLYFRVSKGLLSHLLSTAFGSRLRIIVLYF